MVFKLNVEISAGKFETIKTYSKVIYDIPLNGTRYFDVVVDASGSDYRTDFALNKKILFYYNSVLELKGEILKRSHTSTGELRLEGIGFMEKTLQKANCETQTFSNKTTTQIMNSEPDNLLGQVSGITKGTMANRTPTEFRTDVNQNVLEATAKLCELTGQDWSSDDVNDEIDISNHLGSASSVATLQDGIDVRFVINEEDASKVIKKVTVIGKGFGDNRKIGAYGPGFSQGDGEITRTDKTLATNADCDTLAEKIYEIESLARYAYSFEVIDPFLSFSLGDVITLNSPKIGVSNVELRIVRFKRTVAGTDQRLLLEVRGTGEREAKEDAYRLGMLNKQTQNESQTMTQPTDNGTGVIGIDGDVLDGVSDTDIVGDVLDGVSDTSVTGDIDISGSSDTGYNVGPYTDTTWTKNTNWQSVESGPGTGNVAYTHHAGWIVVRLVHDTGSTHIGVSMRIINVTDGTYYPNSSGVKIMRANYVSQTEPVSAFGLIVVPLNWTNKTYGIQIKNDIGTDITVSVDYGYYGIEGHTHTEDFDTSDLNHPHGDDFYTSDADHPHGDNFSCSDLGHKHG